VMAWFEGERHATAALEWMEQGNDPRKRMKRMPQSIGGLRQPMSAQRRKAA